MFSACCSGAMPPPQPMPAEMQVADCGMECVQNPCLEQCPARKF